MNDQISEKKIAGCSSKVAFDNRRIATVAARRVKGRSVYRCKFCGKWHVAGPGRRAR